ncbi:hypothetical protein Tco_0393118 [Tanacetum coccineum]
MVFDLTKSDLFPSFVEDSIANGYGLRVADSHNGNHREDDFTPLETIRRFLEIGFSGVYDGENDVIEGDPDIHEFLSAKELKDSTDYGYGV